MELAAWEDVKENVQPLKRGRDPKALAAAVKASPADKSERREEEAAQRAAFERSLEDTADPLATWLEYIKWAQERFPSGDRQQGELQLLERATQGCSVERYRDDPRFLRLWVLYADKGREPVDVFKYLWAQEVGTGHALLYEAWAHQLERERKFTEAGQIYEVGIARKAEPLTRLQRRHETFAQRMRDRRERDQAPEESAEPARAALNPLQRSEARALERPTEDRRPLAAQQRGNFEGQRQNVQQPRSWSVLEEPEDAGPDAFAGEDKWGAAYPSEMARQRENAQQASKWNKVRLKQKADAPVAGKISVYVDPELREEDVPERAPAPAAAPPVARALDAEAPRGGHREKERIMVDPGYLRSEDVSFEEQRMAAYLKDASPVRAPGPAPRMGASPTVTMVGEVTMNRVAALINAEPTMTAVGESTITGAAAIRRGQQDILQAFSGALPHEGSRRGRFDIPEDTDFGAPPAAMDKRPDVDPDFGALPKARSAFAIPQDEASPPVPSAKPKPRAAFGIPTDEPSPPLAVQPSAKPKARGAFEIPEDSDLGGPMASKPKPRAAFDIPEDTDFGAMPKARSAFAIAQDEISPPVPVASGKPKSLAAFGIPLDEPSPPLAVQPSAKPKARGAFEIPEDSDLGGPLASKPKPRAAFDIPEDTDFGALPKARTAFDVPADALAVKPQTVASILGQLDSTSPEQPEATWASAAAPVPESGLREADLPVWRRGPMTPGAESTHYSTASQVPGRELFAATENFLSRAGARLSFGTPAGDARDAADPRQLLAALDEPSPHPAALGGDADEDVDKENDGVWPSVRRPVDPQRALQGLRAERAEGDEIDAPVEPFTSDGLDAALRRRVRENEDGRYAFAIFEDDPRSAAPVPRAQPGMDADPAFLLDFPDPPAGAGSGPDAQALYRHLREAGPLYEHAAWDRHDRAWNLPTGRAFVLLQPAPGPRQRSDVLAKEAHPNSGKTYLLRWTSAHRLAQACWARSQLPRTASWEADEEVHVRVEAGEVQEAVGIAPARCPLSALAPGPHAALFAVREMAARLEELHAANLVHCRVDADAFVVSRGQNAAWRLLGTGLDHCVAADGHVSAAYLGCPELLAGDAWTFQVDLFGLACTAYRVLTGRALRVSRHPSGPSGRWLPEGALEPFWAACLGDLLNVPLGSQIDARASCAVLQRWHQEAAQRLPADFVPAALD